MKKLIAILLSLVLTLALTACGTAESVQTAQPVVATVPLTQEESGILEAMGEDVNVIANEDYIHTVAELLYHGDSFSGQVYQLEGSLRKSDEGVFVYRNLVHDGEKTELGLPLRNLEKDVPDGAWVQLTGIVAVDEDGNTVLDVVAIVVPAEVGEVDMDWAGGELHQH